jgi:hypothetical protein
MSARVRTDLSTNSAFVADSLPRLARKRSALLALVLLAACSAPAPTPEPTPEPLTITGTFTLRAPGSIRTAQAGPGAKIHDCAGRDGYSDIDEGLGVTVRDEDGTTIGSSRLTQEGLEEVGDENRCHFTFAVQVTPASFYAIEVGDRGEITYSHADMEAAGWQVELSLGD